MACETDLMASETVLMAGETVLMAGETVLMAGETVLMAGETVLMAGETVLMAGETVLMAGETVLMAGETDLMGGAATNPDRQDYVIAVGHGYAHGGDGVETGGVDSVADGARDDLRLAEVPCRLSLPVLLGGGVSHDGVEGPRSRLLRLGHGSARAGARATPMKLHR